MKRIQQKIKELLAYNNIEPIYEFTERNENPNGLMAIMERQETLLNELRVLARKNCTILGREIKFQMADSYAVYVVTKVGEKHCEVTWVRWCDAWQDDRLGTQGLLDTAYVMQKTKQEDAMELLFSKNKCV